MRLGIHFGPAVLKGQPFAEQWREHVAAVQIGRDLGFDFVSVGHHYVIDPFQYFSMMPWLAALADHSGDMLLATAILLLPMVNPLEAAESVATLDVISGGRVRFGVGLGYREMEFEAFGIPLRERAARFVEALALIRRLWTEDEVTHHGRFFHLSGGRPSVRPLQQPGPPVWVACMGDKSVDRAAQVGDALYISPFQPIPVIERQLARFHALRKALGRPRPTEQAAVRELVIAPTRGQALALGEHWVRAKYGAYVAHGAQSQVAAEDQQLNAPLSALARDTFLMGSPEDCAREVERYHALGFTHLALRLIWPGMTWPEVRTTLELLGREVLPHAHAL